MDVDVQPETAALLKVLGEPVRWRIVQRLAGEELCACHLVEDLGLAQPLISHHLKVLREVGIVEAERYRQWTYHRLVPEVVAAVAAELGRVAAAVPPAGAPRRPCC